MHFCKIANHEMYVISETGQVHSGIRDLFLTPRNNQNGYQIVTLDGEQLLIHRLVALHYLPNPYGYRQINHIDGNKANNHVSNLEWCSAEQNAQHALETGLRGGFVHVDLKRQLLLRVLAGEIISDIAPEVGNHPNTLTRMLRVQAMKDGMEAQWKSAMVERRKATALRNLEIINA